MTLHDRARKLAEEYDIAPFLRTALAMDVMQLARDFASDALYEFCDIIDASGTQRGELAAAVAAAEKGSTDE